MKKNASCYLDLSPIEELEIAHNYLSFLKFRMNYPSANLFACQNQYFL